MTPLRSQRISPHFTWGEFFDRRRHLAPPMPSRRGVRLLCTTALEPLRAAYGTVTVYSGYRTPATNRLVGGAPQSRHLYDLFPTSPAADVACAHGSPRDWYALLDDLDVGGLGIYSTHVHVDLRNITARW